MNPSYVANPSFMSNPSHNNSSMAQINPLAKDIVENMAGSNINSAINHMSNLSLNNSYATNSTLAKQQHNNFLNGQMANNSDSDAVSSNYLPHMPPPLSQNIYTTDQHNSQAVVNGNLNATKFMPIQSTLPNTVNPQISLGLQTGVQLQTPQQTIQHSQLSQPGASVGNAGSSGQIVAQTDSQLPSLSQSRQPLSQLGQFPPSTNQMPPLPGQVVSSHSQGSHMAPKPSLGPPLPTQQHSGHVSQQLGQMPPVQGHLQSAPMPFQSPMSGHMPQPNQIQQVGHAVSKQSNLHDQQQSYMHLPPRSGNIPTTSGQMISHPGQMPSPGQMPPPGQISVQNMQYGNINQGYNQAPLGQTKNLNTIPPRVQMNQMPGSMMPVHAQTGYPPNSYPPQNNLYQQPQQTRRLDPDQMPSPIQVTSDDQKTRSGVFTTDQKGAVPPLVTTNFITQDQGNASPRYIRSSMYNVATTVDMMKQTSVPFGLVISPFAKTLDQELVPPIVNLGELGPVRCIRCKAYMCPFMQFIDSGRRFQCLFCKATTEVPTEYFQHLDQYGLRMDRFERPELMLGTYEFVATKDYCRENQFPKPPAIVFVIDVSYNNIKSGLVNLLCAEMKQIIKNLPTDQGQVKSNMRVGFITYNNTVHFYNIKPTLAQPQMLVVGDLQEMFMPLLDGFLCDPDESEVVIDTLMLQIPIMFADTRETETILAPAIEAGLAALKASGCSGKLLIFHSTLPVAEAPGKLKNRDDRKLLGTDKEKSILTPQCNVYTNLGRECVASGCSVDLFLFNNSFIDIATIGQVPKLTGGEVYKYTYFLADTDGHRLITDIVHNISRPVAFDAIMRVRTSTGIRPTDFYGHFYMSNTTDMELASIDCDKAVAIEIKHDDKLTEEEGVYIQVALLYTSCGGQRRLRIINLSLKTCAQMADLYRSCDLDTVINFFSKQAMTKMLESTPKAYKEDLVNRCAQILACYRKNCASPSSAGQLILPECMKLLPLYMNCLLKSDALSGGSDMTVDDRSFVMQAVMTMDLPSSVVYFYPRLISLHDLSLQDTNIPVPIRCSVDKMLDEGAYLLENGIHMFLWLGLSLSQEWVQAVFGVPTCAQIDTDKVALPILENPLSERVRKVISSVRKQSHRCMRLTLVRQRDKLEPVCKHFLVEDRGTDGSSSYVDFLCHMHKEIRMLLS